MPLQTDVKFFTSAMPGAPALNNAAGSIIPVLDACLVNGFDTKTLDSLVVSSNVATATIAAGHSYRKYAVIEISGATPSELNGQHRITSTTGTTFTFETTGIADQTATGTITSKMAPAGWTKPYTGTNEAVYAPNKVGASFAFFRVIDTTSQIYEIRCYESMTSVSVGSNEMLSQYRWFFKSSDSNNKPWTIIANANFVYIINQSSTSYDNTVGVFGDIESRKQNDSFRSIIRGNNSSASYTSPTNSSYSIGSIGGISLKIQKSYTSLGGPTDVRTVSVSAASSWNSGDYGLINFPNGPDFGLVLFETFVLEEVNLALRGKIPGMYVSPQNLRGKLGQDNIVRIVENITDMAPDSLMFIVPYSVTNTLGNPGYIFINATKWNN